MTGMPDSTLVALAATLKKLLASSDYSDLIITCGKDLHKVHKAIVCSRSEFFRRAEKFPGGEKAARDTIDLPEDEPQMVQLLIQYMYEGDYEPKIPLGDVEQWPGESPVATAPRDPKFHYNFPHTCIPECPVDWKVCPHHECRDRTCEEACQNFVCQLCCEVYTMGGNPDDLILHAKMYEIGDKYVVEGLQDLAQEKFERSCNSHWDTEHFAPAMYHAFSSTVESNKGLRDIIINTISKNINVLSKPEMEALLYEFNDLTVGLLKKKAKCIGWTRSEEAPAWPSGC